MNLRLRYQHVKQKQLLKAESELQMSEGRNLFRVDQPRGDRSSVSVRALGLASR